MQIIRKRQIGKTNARAIALDDKKADNRGKESSESKEDMSRQDLLESSESVNDISQKDLLEGLEQLNEEFKEFEKIREGIKRRISSIVKLIPGLNEKKQLLQKDIDENRAGIQQLEGQFPAFDKQKEELLHSIPQKEAQKALLEKQIRLEEDKVKKIERLITTLTHERTKIKKSLQQNQAKMRKIDKQIEQIKTLQKYGVDLVSTVVYASQ